MAMMTIGDFFSTAPHARPVNPRQVTFTAISKGETHLPGGKPNPDKKTIAAKVVGCLVFGGGDLVEESRDAARKALREKFFDEKTRIPLPIDAGDFNIELTYQMLQRVLYEYDPATKKAGAPLFPTVDLIRKTLVFAEADRVMGKYNEYVTDEHPEVVDADTFRKAEGAGGDAPAGQPD